MSDTQPSVADSYTVRALQTLEGYVRRRAVPWLLSKWPKLHSVTLAPYGLRFWILAGVAAALLFVDWKAAKALGFGLGLVAAALAFVHFWRKTAHPQLDIGALAEISKQHPIAAAIVVVGFFGLQAVVLLVLLFAVIR